MADFGRWNPGSNPNDGQPSLQDIHQSEQFLDALASGRPVYANDPGEDELAYLLAGWRDSARNPPMRMSITEQDAVAALQRGLPRPQRGGAPNSGRRFSLTVVGAAAAAVLCLGGFGAVVAGSGPGDPLYGLRTGLFGDVVRDDPVVLAAQTELAEVEQLIEQGDWDTAQQRLQAVTTTVATVGDETRKQELVAEWQELSVKVESRNPDATVPPDAPPVTLPVIPPATDSATTTEPTEPGASPTEPTEPGSSPTEPTEPRERTEPGAGAGATEPTAPGTPPGHTTEPTDPDTGGPTPRSPGAEPTTVDPPTTTATPSTAPPTSVPTTTAPTPSTTAPTSTTTPAGTTPATTTAVTSATREPAAGERSAGAAAPSTEEAVAEEPATEQETATAAPTLPATTTSVPAPSDEVDG